jgi:putative glutamine amidotransferase
MKSVGLSKMGLNSTTFYRNLLNSINYSEELKVESINFSNNYDFILLDGGSDVSPNLYGEKNTKSSSDSIRDSYEKDIYSHYKNSNTKFVGICRGLQFLNVMYKGTLYQNLGDYGLQHSGEHYIEIDNTIIKFLPKITCVNSLHHQAIKELGKGLFPIAIEVNTKIIEIIGEVNDKIRAVQFHPEWMYNFPYTKEILCWLFRYY